MAETKDNTLSIIALVALVAVVGMVVAFAVSSKGGAQATPVFTAAPANSEKTLTIKTNAAGQMMEMDGEAACGASWCGPCSDGRQRWECSTTCGGGVCDNRCYVSSC